MMMIMNSDVFIYTYKVQRKSQKHNSSLLHKITF